MELLLLSLDPDTTLPHPLSAHLSFWPRHSDICVSLTQTVMGGGSNVSVHLNSVVVQDYVCVILKEANDSALSVDRPDDRSVGGLELCISQVEQLSRQTANPDGGGKISVVSTPCVTGNGASRRGTDGGKEELRLWSQVRNEGSSSFFCPRKLGLMLHK